LNLEQFDTEKHSPAAGEKVAADVESGNRLGVDGTPTVFLNGRRVPYLTPGGLDILIHHLLGDRH
jgi:protein-disulfide isomerase